MKGNKHVNREDQDAGSIFDNRSLDVDYRTLKSLLKEGMNVLDVGCGTGAISKDVAKIVGPSGTVVGIDNTESFIISGKQSYRETTNLTLLNLDLFEYQDVEKFDLIISARVLQWLSNPKEALMKMKSLLKPKGLISILDYNHTALEWIPAPPESMKIYYQTFLKWRADSGINNRIIEEVPRLMSEVGFHSIEIFNSDEYYTRDRSDFASKVGIWSKVAGSKQMVEEGYLKEELRVKAIEEYNYWVENEAVSMTMKLNEVRGKNSMHR
jgi:ubiquinone/menaquinone biosynthesis C-methylase UbiE